MPVTEQAYNRMTNTSSNNSGSSWLSAVPILGGFLDSIFGNRSRKKQQQRQFRHNFQMAEWNWAKNLEMWHMQNAYNTPSSQMARFKDAGLNPHLIYGQGSHGNSSQTPKYQRDTVDYQTNFQPYQLSGVLGNYLNMKSTKAQIDNIKQQTLNARKENENLVLDGIIKGWQGQSERAKSIRESILSQYEDDYARLRNDNLRKDIDSKIADINFKDESVRKTISEINLNEQDYNLMKEYGISKSSPVLMKNAKYIATASGLSERQLLQIVGGALGLKILLQGVTGIITKGVGKAAKTNKKVSRDFQRQNPKDIPLTITNK